MSARPIISSIDSPIVLNFTDEYDDHKFKDLLSI